MISESLRLELEPLGVRVITAMVGEVKTNFFENRPSLPALRKDSLYAAASEGINAMARGDLQLKQEDPTEFAAFMVSSIMRGATGCIYKGGNAVTGKWASALMPTRLLVGRYPRISAMPANKGQDRIVSRGTGLDKLLSR